MGAGASAALDESTMQQFISEDLERAEEVLATAQRLVAQEKRARSHADGPGVVNSLHIQGLDGSTFQLPVDDATTVADVSKQIAEMIEMKPSSTLVLTSGGSVLNESLPVLEQVESREVSFVVKQISPYQAVRSFQRAVNEASTTSLSAADLSAIDAVSSLATDDSFNASLEDIPLPSRLKKLTLGSDFNKSLKGVRLPMGLETMTFGVHFDPSLHGYT
ncbi:unnamed protein product [Symbiodinium sp. CCMP2456]|nr:unnamed protein product [Symbiodinium sp. CCMP2456]